MAKDRKIFPVEKVLELVMGKDGADITEIADFVAGRTIVDKDGARTVAPFASAWLARWYPKFMELDWDGKPQSWNAFVAAAKARLGDNLSITPISGRLKTITDQALEELRESAESLAKQTRATVDLEKRVKELQPLETALKTEKKKNDELEEKLKQQKTDMGALRRQVAEFQGKVAIDHDELMQNIKDAIKDGLKGVTVGAAVAGATAASAAAEEEAPKEKEIGTDDFGFMETSSEDGFGF